MTSGLDQLNTLIGKLKDASAEVDYMYNNAEKIVRDSAQSVGEHIVPGWDHIPQQLRKAALDRIIPPMVLLYKEACRDGRMKTRSGAQWCPTALRPATMCYRIPDLV